MPKFIEKIELNKETFNRLLDWLDNERERAEEMYADIYDKLVHYFIVRQCDDAETLTDKTFDTVLKKIHTEKIDHHGTPLRYFYGIAKYVQQEYLRERELHLEEAVVSEIIVDEKDEEDKKTLHIRTALERCLMRLKAKDRHLIIEYFSVESGREKKARKNIAEKFNINVNSLRVNIFRLKKKLETCIKKARK